MFRARSILLIFITLFTFNLLSPTSSLAKNNFLTQIEATYEINESGETSVSQQITLTNLDSSFYATEYALEIGSNRLSDINATTQAGDSIPHDTTVTENSTAIKLTFDDPSIGKGKTSVFTISYKNPDIAIQNGSVLEVNIPSVNTQALIDDLTTILIIPQFYGKPFRASPENYDFLNKQDTGHFVYHHQQTRDTGLSLIFGKEQHFDFTLNYHLENQTVNQGLTQIALPPDTSHQKLHYHFIDPKPQSLTTDPDGNWLATYSLKPQQRLDVIAQGVVTIYLEPTVPVPGATDNLNHYLEEQPFWPVSDPEIQDLANRLQTPGAIYTFLVENFTYNYSRLDSSTTNRLGAKQALSDPTNVICQEFTDAFITLARAAGIPTREHTGFAFTKNPSLRPLGLVKDVLHSWPEYYDPASNSWIQVDPTWGNTTSGIDYFNALDLNHFTFAIHGSDSTTPIPAGYYKIDKEGSKDVLVEFAAQPPSPTLNFDFDLHLSPLHFLGLNSFATLVVTNHGDSALYGLPLQIAANSYTLTQPPPQIQSLLPFSSGNLRLKLKPQEPFQTANDSLIIKTQGQTFTHDFNPIHFQTPTSPLFIALIVATLTFIPTYFTGRVLVPRLKKFRALRR